MNKTQFRTQTKRFKKEISRLFDEKLERVITSGCMDIESCDDLKLSKMFISAFGRELERTYQPPQLYRCEKMEINNIYINM